MKSRIIRCKLFNECLKVMKHYFMFIYMLYSLKMARTKDHRGL